MQPEARTKVTKEVLCEESRFILANVMAEARYGRQNRYDDIRRACEGAITIPFAEYVNFLDAAGYLQHDRTTQSLEVTKEGESIVNGGNLAELTERAVAHFKQARRRGQGDKRGSEASIDRGIERGNERGSERSDRGSDRFDRAKSTTGRSLAITPAGQTSGVVGGEIQTSSEMLDSRYEKLDSLGTGGIGMVYRARQVPLDREVALKEIRELFKYFSDELRPEIVRRFTEVVRAAAQLSHPNIVPIHEVNLERQYPYVVSELAPNGSCRRLINDADSIPVELVLRYLLQILHALQAAHQQHIYHRGLKPENLLIDAYGNVKISDFGFARIVERDQAVIRQVYVGMNNIAYMAPELYHDPMAAGPQSDIYALGIIFYELLARRLPGRRSPMPSEINVSLPPGIDDIFDHMTRDARTERYSSVSDILHDLSRLEGLSALLDHNAPVLVAENPLEALTFRSTQSGEIYTSADDATITLEPDGLDDKGKSYRPYSYQQRRKR
jgi:eukaryotic-like serine/threonine-protein kinase